MNAYETRKSCNKEIFLTSTKIKIAMLLIKVIVVYNFPKFKINSINNKTIIIVATNFVFDSDKRHFGCSLILL